MLDEISNNWLDTWSVMPGRAGASKGELPYGGNYTFDGSKFGMFPISQMSVISTDAPSEPKVPDMTEVIVLLDSSFEALTDDDCVGIAND